VSSANGANPLRWDCEKRGCFNKKKRPKIEMFADCLPGRCAFSDIDAIAEVNGNFLIQEWKGGGGLPTGQRIMFERMTSSSPVCVFVVEGNAESMTVTHMTRIWRGVIHAREPSSMESLRGRIAAWAKWAGRSP